MRVLALVLLGLALAEAWRLRCEPGPHGSRCRIKMELKRMTGHLRREPLGSEQMMSWISPITMFPFDETLDGQLGSDPMPDEDEDEEPETLVAAVAPEWLMRAVQAEAARGRAGAKVKALRRAAKRHAHPPRIVLILPDDGEL